MAALLPAFHGFHLQQPLSRQSGACRETAHQAGNMFSHQGIDERVSQWRSTAVMLARRGAARKQGTKYRPFDGIFPDCVVLDPR
ncbi:hypothetical protein CTAM01_05173 [Colletotrichum tamarilloi]|uniref:Uncharacterized protein n=1 Tax=Colletotrichum tamarilloi TaxID=1209934 RepID=A0ABQ9RF11_9PEZI|nr:uncharacterized protein CTAM01_05173 [Colletotrichum tamarilloi]KAK1502360.1 hypothetical protein CTAM01_05173 [Colletotrichum tamarilloi]